MHLVPGGETDFIVIAVCTGTPIHIEFVRKRASRANALFLMRHPRRMSRSPVDLFNLVGSKFSVVRWDLFVASLLDTHDKLVAVEKIESGFFRIIRAKGRGQVSRDCSPPRADVLFMYRLAVFLLKKSFQEHRRRGGIEVLWVDPSAAAPRRRNDHGHTKAHAYWSGTRIVLRHTLAQFVFLVAVFETGINARGRSACRRAPGIGRDKRWGMVEVAVVLVVGEDEDRLLPNLGIFRQDVHHLGDIPGSEPG